MAKYKMVINTDEYTCERCSKKNWEPGTRNDYMLAINGITRTLYSLKEVLWQLELFGGRYFLLSEYSEDNPEENNGLSDRYVKFLRRTRLHIMTDCVIWTEASIYQGTGSCRVLIPQENNWKR